MPAETTTHERVAKRPAQRPAGRMAKPAKRTTRRGAAYIRYSVERDGKLSDQTQLAAIKGKAASKEIDIAPDLVFIDRGKSAGEGKHRPQLERLLDAVRAGRVEYVVVHKLDRFTRSLRDFTELMSVLRDHGVELIVVDNDFDSSSAFGKMMLSILAMFAEMERDMIVSRNQNVAAFRREQGMVGGTAPFGYRKVGMGATATFEIEPAEAKLLRTIVDRVIAGESLRSVTRWLDEQGIETKRGNRWNPVTVRQLIVRPTIAGLRNDPNDAENFLVAPWKPIIEVDKWHRLLDELGSTKRKTHAAGVTSTSVGNLLSGVLFCTCGAKMRPRWQNHNDGRAKTRRYQCGTSNIHPDACCGPSVRADDAEQFVTSELMQALQGVRIPPVTMRDDERAAEVEQELDELVVLYEQRRIKLDEYLRLRAAAQGELDRIEAEAHIDRRDSTITKLIGQGVDIEQAWNAVDDKGESIVPLDTKRAVIREVFGTITCLRSDRKGVAQPIATRIICGEVPQ